MNLRMREAYQLVIEDLKSRRAEIDLVIAFAERRLRELEITQPPKVIDKLKQSENSGATDQSAATPTETRQS